MKGSTARSDPWFEPSLWAVCILLAGIVNTAVILGVSWWVANWNHEKWLSWQQMMYFGVPYILCAIAVSIVPKRARLRWVVRLLTVGVIGLQLPAVFFALQVADEYPRESLSILAHMIIALLAVLLQYPISVVATGIAIVGRRHYRAMHAGSDEPTW